VSWQCPARNLEPTSQPITEASLRIGSMLKVQGADRDVVGTRLEVHRGTHRAGHICPHKPLPNTQLQARPQSLALCRPARGFTLRPPAKTALHQPIIEPVENAPAEPKTRLVWRS
jgi:hypothetical protein